MPDRANALFIFRAVVLVVRDIPCLLLYIQLWQEEEFELMAAIGAAAFLEEMARAESKNAFIILLEPLAKEDADL